MRRNPFISLCIGICTMLMCTPTTAIVIRHDIDDKLYHAKTSDFPPLATLYRVGAHGTLVSPEWVITAAHTVFCIEPDDWIKVGDTLYQVAGRFAHYQYERGNDHDIALIKLKKPVTQVSPAMLNTDKSESGQVVWFIGAGGTGNGHVGQTISYKQNAGQLRKAQNRIEKAKDGNVYFEFDQGEDALPLEGVSGNGDSGGPAYIEQQNRYYLLAVSSRTDSWFKSIGEYGVTEVYTRIAGYLPWINGVMQSEPDFLAAYTTQKRFPQPGIEDNLPEVCERIGFTSQDE